MASVCAVAPIGASRRPGLFRRVIVPIKICMGANRRDASARFACFDADIIERTDTMEMTVVPMNVVRVAALG